jgi:2-dehydropantoate 2-reductase
MPAIRRAVVIGAGALGSVYGAALARGGADVQLLARRAHAEAIAAAGGVTVRSVDGDWFAPLRAAWRPADIEPAELAILLCKSYDSAAALEGLVHVGPAVAVSFQNGVEKDAVLARWCGAERILGGMSMVGATLPRPGEVAHTLAGTTYVGELPVGTSDRAAAVGALLEAGGLPTVVTERIASAEWSKLVHAAPTMTLCALARVPFHRELLDPGLAAQHAALVAEGVAIARAAGVDVDDWPGMFPVRTLAAVPAAEAVGLLHARGRAMAAAGSTDVRISMRDDVECGRPIEVEAVQGFLARAAARAGVDAPLTQASYELVRAVDAARGRPREQAAALRQAAAAPPATAARRIVAAVLAAG